MLETTGVCFTFQRLNITHKDIMVSDTSLIDGLCEVLMNTNDKTRVYKNVSFELSAIIGLMLMSSVVSINNQYLAGTKTGSDRILRN